jgi:hypothetical protein
LVFLLFDFNTSPAFAGEGGARQRREGEGLLLASGARQKKKTLTQPSPVKTGEG